MNKKSNPFLTAQWLFGKGWTFSCKGNTAQLRLRRFAEILRPDFVAISCNTSSIPAKLRRISTQNFLANRSPQIMRCCLKLFFPVIFIRPDTVKNTMQKGKSEWSVLDKTG